MTRRDTRVLALKTLFAYEVEKGDCLTQYEYISTDPEMAGVEEQDIDKFISNIEDKYAKELINGIIENKTELDDLITELSIGWDVNRIGINERNILRLALFEMNSCGLAPAIAINEALEICKEYSGEESSKFINGILGKQAEIIKGK